MAFRDNKIVKRFFGESVRHEFSNTPLVDAMEAETYGNALVPYVSKDEALSVPGVMTARNSITAIATLPLKTYSSNWREVNSPLFKQIDPTRANVVVLADTLEDLFLSKYAYWRVLERDARDFPTKAEYVDIRLVSDPTTPLFQGEDQDKIDNTIRINGDIVSWADVIRFESPNPAFLKHGGRVVRRALDLDLTSAKYARNPKPLNYFRSTDPGVDPDEGMIKAFLRKWKLWNKTETTGFVPGSLEYVTVEQPTPAELQLIDAQKQVGLSIANMTGLDPEDLGISTTSRTYFNAQQKRMEKVNDVLAPYMRAITDRLSMGDVTRRGQVVQFDLTDYLKADDKTRADVQLAYHAAGLLTDDEIRNAEKKPALTSDQKLELESAGASNGAA